MAAPGGGARGGSFEAFLDEELAALRAALTKRAAALEAENARLHTAIQESGRPEGAMQRAPSAPALGPRFHDGQPEAESLRPQTATLEGGRSEEGAIQRAPSRARIQRAPSRALMSESALQRARSFFDERPEAEGAIQRAPSRGRIPEGAVHKVPSFFDEQPEAEASPPRLPARLQAAGPPDGPAEDAASKEYAGAGPAALSFASERSTPRAGHAALSFASESSAAADSFSERNGASFNHREAVDRAARHNDSQHDGSASLPLRRRKFSTVRQRQSLRALKSRSGTDLNSLMPDLQVSGKRFTKRPGDNAESVAFVRGRASGTRPAGPLRASWGWWRQQLAHSFIGFVIVLNALALGLSIEYSPDWGGWLVVDSVFAIIFTAELLVNLRLYGLRTYFFGPGRPCSNFDVDLRWRLLEFLLVCLAIWEIVAALTVGTAEQGRIIFRMLRFARIARIVRLCRLSFFAELTSMVNGAIGGVRTLAWSMMLMMLPLYVFALVMREGLAGSGDREAGPSGLELGRSFQDLGASFFTIFRCTMGAECITRDGKPIFLIVMEQYGGAYGIVYAVVQVIFTFGLFNLVTAFFVENTVAAAKEVNKQQTRQRLLDTQGFREKMLDLVNVIIYEYQEFETARGMECEMTGRHSVESIVITAEFFRSLQRDAKFVARLNALDISVADQLDLFDTLDIDASGVLDMEELVGGICKLRGEARRGDIVETALVVRAIQLHLQMFDEQVMTTMAQLKSEVRAMGRRLPSAPSGAPRAKAAVPRSEWRPQDWAEAQGSEGE